MRAVKLAALMLLALPLCAAQAKPPKLVHRISPARGFSYVVPDGWMACDAATNRVLGNADHPIVLNRICASARAEPGAITLVSIDVAHPLGVQVLFDRDFTVPDAFLQSVTPDTMEVLKGFLCEQFAQHYGSVLNSCDADVTNLAGHPAIRIRAQIGAGERATTLRAYNVSGGGGSLYLTFYTHGTAPLADNPLIDAVMASVEVPPFAAEAPELVTLQAAPGATVSIPKGWVACDAANNALLGGAKDAEGGGSYCPSTPTPDTTLRVHDPRAFHGAAVTFFYFAANGTSAGDVKPDAIAQNKDAVCGDARQSLTGDGSTLDSCDVSAVTVGGGPARLMTVLYSIAGPKRVQRELRIYDMPCGKGALQIQTDTPVAFKPVTGAELDAAVASVVIQ